MLSSPIRLVIVFGNSDRLSNYLDFRAEICGVDGLVHLPYLYFGSPSQDTKVAWCVDQCPQTTGTKICMYDIDHFTVTPFCYVQMKCDQIGRFCMPNEPVNRVELESHLTTLQYQIKRFASDIWLVI